MTAENWKELNQRLGKMSEREVSIMLEAELRGPNRQTFVRRLHQRLGRLRMQRERAAMMGARPKSLFN